MDKFWGEVGGSRNYVQCISRKCEFTMQKRNFAPARNEIIETTISKIKVQARGSKNIKIES
uniref:Uncharacterized protein n=1 Tax=Megaselia scalaris TaxID=36166 RepID=T1GSV4_MEGSC